MAKRTTLKIRDAEILAAQSVEDLAAAIREACAAVRYGEVVFTVYKGEIAYVDVCQRTELTHKIKVS